MGTLAGKGKLSDKHKGGKVVIKVDEPSYLIGIVSFPVTIGPARDCKVAHGCVTRG